MQNYMNRNIDQSVNLSLTSVNMNMRPVKAVNTNRATNKANKIDAKIDPKLEQKIDASAQEFEAVFLSEMIKPMFEGIETEGLFGGGKAEEVFRGILIQEYGKKIAAAGGIGLSSQLKSELLRMQGMTLANKNTQSTPAKQATQIMKQATGQIMGQATRLDK